MTRTLSAVAVLAFVALAPAAPVPKAKKVTYPHAKGTKWEYIHDGDEKNVYAEEVVEVEEKDGVISFKVAITPGDGRDEKLWEKYQIKDGKVAVTGASWGEFAEPMVIRTDDMKEGDTWTAEYTQGGRKYTDTFTVGKAEEITTPAGKWTATPVTRKTVKPEGTASVYWYVDGVGMVRSTIEGEEAPAQELKAFTPPKK